MQRIAGLSWLKGGAVYTYSIGERGSRRQRLRIGREDTGARTQATSRGYYVLSTNASERERDGAVKRTGLFRSNLRRAKP